MKQRINQKEPCGHANILHNLFHSIAWLDCLIILLNAHKELPSYTTTIIVKLLNNSAEQNDITQRWSCYVTFQNAEAHALVAPLVREF